MTKDPLQTRIADELGRPAPAAVLALARELAGRGGRSTSAVLYYGSTLRADALDGVLDFYVLLDDVGAWPGSLLARFANRVLPPNVGYIELAHQGQSLRAKYAVLSRSQFQRRLRRQSLDTTIWARFCQPALCAWARSPQDKQLIVALVGEAVVTAARWAAELGPARAVPEDFWRTLFARTYEAELRVEKTGRPQDIVGKFPERYRALLPLALHAAAVPFRSEADGTLEPTLDDKARRQASRSWNLRQRLGKPLNIVRLLKAAFTFEGALDYVVWKIERHRGVRIKLSPWQRRFPLLAAPGLYWQLRRQGILR